MAAYPDIVQAYGSKIADSSGTVVERSVSGKPRFRSYYTQIWSTITVMHDIDDTDKATLDAHYAADKLNSFSFTYAADSSVYTVRYADAPQYKPKMGNRWSVKVTLIVV